MKKVTVYAKVKLTVEVKHLSHLNHLLNEMDYNFNFGENEKRFNSKITDTEIVDFEMNDSKAGQI